MDYTSSDKIRNYINNLLTIFLTLSSSISKNKEVFYGMLAEHFKRKPGELSEAIDESYSLQSDVINSTSKLVLITDMYLYLNAKASSSSINPSEILLKEYTKQAIESDTFELTLENKDTVLDFISNSINFLNLPRYRKVLMMYLLTDEEVDSLTIFNPLFEYEYNYYHNYITSEFLLEEIHNLIENNTLEFAIHELSYFLCELFFIDEDIVNEVYSDFIESLQVDIEELIDASIDNNYDYLSNVLRKYYYLNKDIVTKKK